MARIRTILVLLLLCFQTDKSGAEPLNAKVQSVEKAVKPLVPQSPLKGTKEIVIGEERGYGGEHCASGIAYSSDGFLVFSSSETYLNASERNRTLLSLLKQDKSKKIQATEFKDSLIELYCNGAAYYPFAVRTDLHDDRFERIIAIVADQGQDTCGRTELILLMKKNQYVYQVKKDLSDILAGSACNTSSKETKKTDPDCVKRDECYANYLSSGQGRKNLNSLTAKILAHLR